MEKSKVLAIQGKIEADDPAFVMFTSGSTGDPKGVQVSHFCMVNYCILAFSDVRCVNDRVFSDRPMTWVAGIYGPISAWVLGRTAVSLHANITVRERQMDILLRILEEEKCTIVLVLAYLMYDIIHCNHLSRYKLDSLKWMLTGSQPLPVESLMALFKKMPSVKVYEGYGSTEMPFFGDRITDASNIHTIGHLSIVPHYEAKIVDDDGKILPLGETGELCVRSSWIFDGYLNDSLLTSQAINKAGWFHTDDLCCMFPEGQFEICGRKGDVIKRATVKVFPAEVENEILKHDAIDQVIVVGVPDERFFEELCALVIPKQGYSSATLKTDILRWCQENFLPGPDGLTLTPKYLLIVEEFPATATGKVDRKALKKTATEKLGLS